MKIPVSGVSLRTARDFLLNWLTAAVGTALISEELARLVEARTARGLYLREIVFSAVVAFLLGYLIFYKWESRTSIWVGVVGVLGFVWRILLGNPLTPSGELSQANLDFVSTRALFYSLGAFCCFAVAYYRRPKRA